MQYSTQAKIIALLHHLSEGDRVRLLQFGEAMLTQRQGKRQQRQRRFFQPQKADSI